MRIEEFDYELPEELIAQKPVKERESCRLMVLDRERNTIEHRHFYDITDYLNNGDCLVLNDSRVIPARLFGIKAGTGASIEFLLIKRIDGDEWETLVRPGRRLGDGDVVVFSEEPGKALRARINGRGEDGTRIVSFSYDGIFMERLEEMGQMPLPPYIERPETPEDKDDYQTVYCREDGSVAAPTAGFHFTNELLARAEKKGVRCAYLTLHVGIGTFRPVKCDNVEDHHMHLEEYCISGETSRTINETILAGGRIVTVGTTSARTLESTAYMDEASGKYLTASGSGSTDIFIYPGYEFRIVDALITNFHLPESTLIMLVSALYDREHILEAYDEAVRRKYRFFSYGDAMLIK